MTSFALLVEPATYSKPDPDLDRQRAIYYVGLLISIAFLLYLLVILVSRRFAVCLVSVVLVGSDGMVCTPVGLIDGFVDGHHTSIN